MKPKYIKPTVPAWAFLMGTVLYNELLLHLWITDPLTAGRLIAVALFALGFGGVLGLLVSLIPSPRWQKGCAVTLAVLIGAFWVTEYFISDAYKVFMTPKLMVSGAGGVAQDYFDLGMSLLRRVFWRILMVMVPPGGYGLFFQTKKAKWTTRGLLTAGVVLCGVLGVLTVNRFTGDAIRFRQAYEFDSAVRCFGLNVAVALETANSGADEAPPAFVEAPAVQELPPEVIQEEPQEDGTPEKVYADNVIERLDFAALAESETNYNVSALHSYVNSLTPTKENEYTGLFKGKNLILITAEALSYQVIDPELPPTLYRMATKGIQFTDYYQPAWGASTTSGEFSNLVGLVPVTGGMCMKEAKQQDLFLTMGHQLMALGYHSAAYHNHLHDFYERSTTHPHLGYEHFLAQYNGLEGVDRVWTESDKQLIDVTIPKHLDEQPFSLYYITVSGHCMYSQNENFQAKKNYDKVAHLPYSEAVKCYFAAQLELEYAMESLLNQLEEAGIADDNVVVMATDHYPYGLERSATWQNTSDYLREQDNVSDYDRLIRDRNALIIWSGCLEDKNIVVEDPVYSLDILPTISNLFGVDYDSRLLVGRDVFSNATPLVLWPDYSWKTDKGYYDAETKKFTPAEGQTVSEEYVAYISSQVANKITYSRSVQSLDYFNYLSRELGRKK